MPHFLRWAVPAVVLTALMAPDSVPAADQVQAVVRWSGTVADPDQEAKKPAGGVVTDWKEFAALWKAWRPNEQKPDIDFASHFVLVVTRQKHTTFVMQINVMDDGDGRVLSGGLGGEKEIPGFGYGLAVFPRGKVKTLGGKAIPAK